MRPKVHMFWRGLQGFWRCTNPACGKLQTELIDRCPVCGARCLPLEVCRSCGQDFFRGYSEGRTDEEKLDTFAHLKSGRARAKKLPPAVRLAEEPHGQQIPVHFTHELHDFREDPEEANEEDGAADRNMGGSATGSAAHRQSLHRVGRRSSP